MSLRPILKYPDPLLRQPTRKVDVIDDPVRTLVADMVETMYARRGAGLAAIQVGSPLKIFIVEASVAGGDENDHPVVFINPRIEWLSGETETADEGCLSFPGIYVPVKRSLAARVHALDLRGKEFSTEGQALYARAMQHEHDHLVGRLLVDFVGPLKRQAIKRKLERMTDEEVDRLQSVGE